MADNLSKGDKAEPASLANLLSRGDFIEFDFIGRIKTSNQIFDLTLADVAKKEGIFDEHREYKPMIAVLGAGMLIKGFDKALEGKEIGKELEFDVQPEEAFGQRNPQMVQLVNLNKFKEFRPVPGIQVNIDGVLATVRAVSGGRVTVDFNHPLAGKALHYWAKILRKITDAKEKLKAAAEFIGLPAGDINVEGKKATIKGAGLGEMTKEVAGQLRERIKKLIPELAEFEFAFEGQKSEKEDGREGHKHS